MRSAVGEATFARILREWTGRDQNRPATTADFIALAERVSGKQLDDLFNTWLYTWQARRPPAAPRHARGRDGGRPRRRDRGRAGCDSR